MRPIIRTAIGCTALLAASCSPKFYTPNTQNVPLMKEKGQTNLTVAGNGNQAEFQAAYALTSHIAVQGNGGLFIPKDLDNGNGGSGRFLEGGVGYFSPVGDNFVFEAYGLLGFGGFENHLPSTVDQYPNTSGKISANIARYSIQPVFGYVSKYFSIAVSSRISSLNYSRIGGNLVYNDVIQTDYLASNRSGMLLEPALTVRGGFERFKLQLQFGGSFNLTNSDFRQDKSYMTLGLNFNFGTIQQ